jgi:hypothetical protein
MPEDTLRKHRIPSLTSPSRREWDKGGKGLDLHPSGLILLITTGDISMAAMLITFAIKRYQFPPPKWNSKLSYSPYPDLFRSPKSPL